MLKLRLGTALLAAVAMSTASLPVGAASWPFGGNGTARQEEDEPQQWEEAALELPAAPQRADLLPFYVSAATDANFFVDSRSLKVGGDGVVRYTLVVESSSGARSVSYEGMRCATRERRLYAFGQRDGSWSKSRVVRWERIHDVGVNRQHAALFLEYLCPGGVIVATADVARRALEKGGYPSLGR